MYQVKKASNIYFLCTIFFFLFASCKKEIEYKPLSYNIKSSNSLAYGYDNRIHDIRKTINGNYRLFLNISDETFSFESNTVFVTISKEGKVLSNKKVSFNYPLTDYLESENGFYVVNTERVTMGKSYTHDFLSFYNRNWNLIWQKELKTEKYPSSNSFLHSINNNLLLITDNCSARKYDISFQTFTKKGELLSNQTINKHGDDPIVSLKTRDNHLIVCASIFMNEKTVLFKRALNGEIIWKTSFNFNFYPTQIMEANNGSLILYGEKYIAPSRSSLLIYKINKKGEVIWKKSIKKNYSENAGNIIKHKNNYVFSSFTRASENENTFPYIFELDENGNLISEKKFNFPVSSKTPYLIDNKKNITMVSPKGIGKLGNPFHDIILINQIKKE